MLYMNHQNVLSSGKDKISLTERSDTRLGATPDTRRTQTMGERKHKTRMGCKNKNDSNTNKERI